VTGLQLAGLYVYPVKSLRGYAVDRVEIVEGRIAGDRLWIVVDAGGAFMHQRDYPRMARVGTSLDGDTLSLRAADRSDLHVPMPKPAVDMPVTYIQLWRRRAPVIPAGIDADRWLTSALGVSCRLMAFVPDRPALDCPSYELQSSLQDATPFHLTTEESLADLNARMAEPIPMNRFRPNLVVRGGAPYAEDDWKRLEIGGTVLRWVKHCTRCAMTMTDHETGARARREPLYTLSTYRRLGSEVAFGHYYEPESWGQSLQRGDMVRVL
jgi:uncharacterized protein YcbX